MELYFYYHIIAVFVSILRLSSAKFSDTALIVTSLKRLQGVVATIMTVLRGIRFLRDITEIKLQRTNNRFRRSLTYPVLHVHVWMSHNVLSSTRTTHVLPSASHFLNTVVGIDQTETECVKTIIAACAKVLSK